MSPSDSRIAYVCKMYPRFSETFIVSEVLAREAAGESIEIVSLRAPADGRFHATLASVQAPVHYLDPSSPRAKDLWSALASAAPNLDPDVLDELLALPVRDAAQVLELAALIRERDIDHLHAHFGSIATTIARLAARATGITYSFTAHAKDIFHESVDEAELALKLRDADHVVTVSNYNLRYLKDRFGSDADGVVRVYNGLDLRAFTFDPALGSRPTDVVAVGRLVEKKGFDVLVEACALTRDWGTPLTARIVGTGDCERQLRSLIAAHDLDGLVGLAGALPQDRVREEIRAAATMAAPCVVGSDGNADGLPTVILESMALGTPVVATPVTGIPEAVIDGTTGRMVEERDAHALATTLLALRDDRDERTRLAHAARRHVEAEFCSRRQAEHLRTLLPSDVEDRQAVA
jgi:colanic acid/amylovoran biosynthesis glycosyltransferase